MTTLRLRIGYHVRYAHDVSRMRSILNARGYDAAPEVIAMAYHEWCDSNWAAGWSGPDWDDEDGVFLALMTDLEPEVIQ